MHMDETLVIHVGKGSEHKIHLLFTPVQLDVLRDTQRDGIGLREFLNCSSQIKCDGLTERIDFSKLHI